MVDESQVDWIHRPCERRRRVSLHPVKFLRGAHGYQAGEVAGFPLDRAYRITRGVTVADTAKLDPEKIPSAVILDADRWQKAMQELSRHNPKTIRIGGIISMLAGAFLLQFLH